MTTHTHHHHAVGVFENHSDAQSAVRALKDAGFDESQIGVAGHDHGGDGAEGLGTRDDRISDKTAADETGETYAGEGAAAGAAAGAGVGALWGLGIVAGVLPGIGPAIAGGTLAVILSSLAAGAAAAGIAGALVGLGFTKEEAEYYESEFNSGRTIVTVKAGSRYDEACSILQQHQGYDMASRSGGQVHTSESHGMTGEPLTTPESHAEHHTVDVPVSRDDVTAEDTTRVDRPLA